VDTKISGRYTVRRGRTGTDDYEESRLPFNRNRHTGLAFPGYYCVNFPVSGIRPQLYPGWTLPYVKVIGYLRNPGFLTRRPFMPFFMAFDRVRYEIPVFAVYPPVNRFMV
jgi:hypothetical protein